MKKLFITSLVILTLFLSGCGNSTYDPPSNSIAVYDQNEFIYSTYPEDWQEISARRDEKLSNMVMGYFSPTPSKEGYFPNLTILKNILSTSMLSVDYSKLSVDRIKSRIIGYEQELYESYIYSDENVQKEAYIHVYTGKESFQAPELRYVQTYLTKGNNIYVETFTLPLDEDYENYMEMAKFTGFLSKNPFTTNE